MSFWVLISPNSPFVLNTTLNCDPSIFHSSLLSRVVGGWVFIGWCGDSVVGPSCVKFNDGLSHRMSFLVCDVAFLSFEPSLSYNKSNSPPLAIVLSLIRYQRLWLQAPQPIQPNSNVECWQGDLFITVVTFHSSTTTPACRFDFARLITYIDLADSSVDNLRSLVSRQVVGIFLPLEALSPGSHYIVELVPCWTLTDRKRKTLILKKTPEFWFSISCLTGLTTSNSNCLDCHQPCLHPKQ